MAKSQTSTAVAVRSSNDLAAAGDPDGVLAELERVLITNEAMPASADDPDRMAAEIVAQILAADTDDELDAMQGGNAIGWRELLDVPIELLGFRWRPSDFDEGSSVYFVVFGRRLDDGENVVLTTGSRNILAQLVNYAKRGVLSGRVVRATQQEKATQRGFHPLWLTTEKPAS